jgi:hypothetical protein
MDDQKISFIPYHAINQFMRNDFRLAVIRSAVLALPDLDHEIGARIDRLTKKFVKVPGFRNSAKAPATVKAVAMVKPFEKSPDLVAAILNAWAESRPELGRQIFELLTERGWKLLPIETNRTKLPGFLTRWPADDDFEVLYDAFTAAHPDAEASIDEVSLMVVWLSSRLPIEKIDKAEMEEPDNSVPDSPEEEIHP